MNSATLALSGVTRRFKDTVALDNLDLQVQAGELVALLGPSGCGKTTALRIIAGLDRADQGEVWVRDKSIDKLPAHKRNMGMVFQSYSLFPNLNAEENVAFGLKMRGASKAQRRDRAHELLNLVGLDHHAKRFTHQLSGGQQQRVALARALAFEPDVLLLDEPLSALDAKVRANLRDEIRALQIKTGTTTIFVTHDQEEAMSMSDRVAVMNGGKIAQIAEPDVLYHTPANEFVAGFVGHMNRIPAKLAGSKAQVLENEVDAKFDWETQPANVVALVRPESLHVAKTEAGNATVVARAFLGPMSKVMLETPEGISVDAIMTSEQSASLHSGDSVKVSVKPGQYLVVPA
jgi:putative spermidine/putrescine transport system ATP-binding protein